MALHTREDQPLECQHCTMRVQTTQLKVDHMVVHQDKKLDYNFKLLAPARTNGMYVCQKVIGLNDDRMSTAISNSKSSPK